MRALYSANFQSLPLKNFNKYQNEKKNLNKRCRLMYLSEYLRHESVNKINRLSCQPIIAKAIQQNFNNDIHERHKCTRKYLSLLGLASPSLPAKRHPQAGTRASPSCSLHSLFIPPGKHVGIYWLMPIQKLICILTLPVCSVSPSPP